MSGETECDGINYDGRDEIKAAISVLRRFDNRHGRDFDGGDKSVCKAITKIETELVDLGRRATPPGYEMGTEAKNPNLLFYEYETDLILAAKSLESSMPNAAGRVRWLASLLAKTKPPKETPNAQG